MLKKSRWSTAPSGSSRQATVFYRRRGRAPLLFPERRARAVRRAPRRACSACCRARRLRAGARAIKLIPRPGHAAHRTHDALRDALGRGAHAAAPPRSKCAVCGERPTGDEAHRLRDVLRARGRRRQRGRAGRRPPSGAGAAATVGCVKNQLGPHPVRRRAAVGPAESSGERPCTAATSGSAASSLRVALRAGARFPGIGFAVR